MFFPHGIRATALCILSAPFLFAGDSLLSARAPLPDGDSFPAGETLPAEGILPAGGKLPGDGPRMLSLTRKGSRLCGNAPRGQGAPFCILNGSTLLWTGGEGEAFSVPVETGKHLYLLSLGADNKNWQALRWEGETPPTAADKTASAADKTVLHFTPPPGEEDAGPPLRQLIDQARRQEGEVIIDIPRGVYHFYPEGAVPVSLYTSNHDQQDIHPVGIPLVNLNGVHLEGNGARFVFHGRIMPFLIMDSADVTCSNLSIAYSTPFYSEGRIIDISGGRTTLQFDPHFSWKVKEKKFFNTGEGWENEAKCALAFQQDGAMVPTGKKGDIPWTAAAEQLPDRKVRFNVDAAQKYGLSEGQILVLRSYARPHPAMVLYRALRTHLKHVVFHDSQGMGLLAQRSEDISISGGGCIRDKNRVHTTAADATHFSNCRGKIRIEDALYEGMMDDAINVHSTCLAIRDVLSPTEIVAEYRHPQAVGLEVLLPGEHLQFIHRGTLENTGEKNSIRVLRVRQLNERRLAILLEEPLPAGIGVGDALENTDWYPSVLFRGNTVRHNRARCALFTTPRPVRVVNNRFLRCSGSAILLAGDAGGWYESGRCRDVEIRNNVFDHNLTCRYQFTEGIISIFPEIDFPDRQKTRYHENIRIEGNTFRTHRVPLLFALSARNIIFRNNTVFYDDKYPPLHGGRPFILYFCEDAHLELSSAMTGGASPSPPQNASEHRMTNRRPDGE